MIRSWQHKGLKNFYDTGNPSGIQPKHSKTIGMLLLQLAGAIRPEDMNTPGNHFHKLTGELKGFYSVKVNKNWRLIFKFDETDAFLVDYVDYH